MSDTPDRMSPHAHLQAVVGEWADDYILIARVGDQTAVCMSDSRWARALLATGQVDDAVNQQAQAEAEMRKHDERRHHGAGEPGPRMEAPPAAKESAE